MKVSKKHLLEWLTAEQAEKQAKTDLVSYYKFMWANLVFGILSLAFGIVTNQILLIIVGALLGVAPIFAWYISKDIKKVLAIEKVSEEDKQYLIEIGKKTWQYFKDNIDEENNYLAPDNYQEDRINKVAPRTSTTNIGLGMLSVISAYDLKYIEQEEAIDILSKTLDTITKLQKWNGHLYNWYNTNTLEPLIPRYISTVDNGNFIGYLYTVKQFLINALQNTVGANCVRSQNENTLQENVGADDPVCPLENQIMQMLQIIDNIINTTDFSILYDHKKHLFSIGFDVEQNKLTNSYYDLLASEARQASLVAIAKKDINPKHWNSLSRTLTSLRKYKGLISWSGTAFEYLMPNVNIKNYEGSLLDESCRFLIMSQMEYAKKLRNSLGNIRSSIQFKRFK